MSRSIRVLLVDDEKQFVVDLAKILSRRGFEVSTAFDGYQAVNAVKSQACFDVVILDIKMPGMDGIATLEEIRNLSPDSRVIMLTGYASLESGARALRLGAYDYLMKPTDIEDVIEKIREVQEAACVVRDPVLWKRNTVGALTLPSIGRLSPEDPLFRALKMMSTQYGQGALEEVCVVDYQDRLQGIVTKRDLLGVSKRSHPAIPLTWDCLLENTQFLPEGRVGDIMRKNPLTASPDESVAEVAQFMIKNNILCMPVTNAGKLIGHIRLQDIFRYVGSKLQKAQSD